MQKVGRVEVTYYYMVTSILFTTGCVANPNKWKIGENTIHSSTFELHSGQSAIYAGTINSGLFTKTMQEYNFTEREKELGQSKQSRRL